MATTIEDMPPPFAAPPSGDSAKPGMHPGTSSGGEPQSRPAAARRVGGDGGRSVSSGVIISGIVVVLVAGIGVFGALLVAQLTAINDAIGRLDTGLRGEMAGIEANLNARIDRVETGLRGEMSGLRGEMAGIEANLNARIDGVETSLRGEMQAGFAQINAVLLDHTDRLSRLESRQARQ